MDMMVGDQAAMQSWHDGGLFMGMHWLWWLIWICTIGVLVWGFQRIAADRRATQQRLGRESDAEEALRRRFANGEISEDELTHAMKVLRETTQGR